MFTPGGPEEASEPMRRRRGQASRHRRWDRSACYIEMAELTRTDNLPRLPD